MLLLKGLPIGKIHVIAVSPVVMANAASHYMYLAVLTYQVVRFVLCRGLFFTLTRVNLISRNTLECVECLIVGQVP